MVPVRMCAPMYTVNMRGRCAPRFDGAGGAGAARGAGCTWRAVAVTVMRAVTRESTTVPKKSTAVPKSTVTQTQECIRLLLYVVYRLRTLHLTTSLRSALGYDRTRMNYRVVCAGRRSGTVMCQCYRRPDRTGRPRRGPGVVCRLMSG